MLHEARLSPTSTPAKPPEFASFGSPLSDLRIIWGVIDTYLPNTAPEDAEPIEKRLTFHLYQLREAFTNIDDVRGKRILDLACGSRTYEDDPLKRYEPWMCRLLLQLGAIPVGVDLAAQREERFESHRADLTISDSLSFLPSHSFDAAYVSAFPTRKAIWHLDSKGLKWPSMREDILSHMRRCLKPEGVIIRQFSKGDEELVQRALTEVRKSQPTQPASQPAPQPPSHDVSPLFYRDEDMWF